MARSRYRWACGVRRMSAACWLMELRVRTPLMVLLFVSCIDLCCVGSGLCDGLIAHPEECCRVCVCVVCVWCVCVCGVCVWCVCVCVNTVQFVLFVFRLKLVFRKQAVLLESIVFSKSQ